MDKATIESLFAKVCTNASPAVTFDGNKLVPFLYRRDDLTEFARQAFEEGETQIYTEPVNPNNPYGPQRRCKPKYVYKLKKPLTEEQYKQLIENIS